MRKILKYLYKNMLPLELKGKLDVFSSFRCRELTEDTLPSGKVVILAPHPDDEVIGCGGTILRCLDRGAEVAVIFMTDGSRGRDGSGADDIVETRKEEARRAAAVLGVEDLTFLGHRDDGMRVDGGTVAELRDLLARLRPEALFLPFVTDQHRDHVATNRLFREAARPFPSLRCFGYVVWSPPPFTNLNVDITAVIEKKKMALGEYRSQLELYSYLEANLGLCRFYSLQGRSKGRGYSEVFVVCTASEYGKLVGLYLGDGRMPAHG